MSMLEHHKHKHSTHNFDGIVENRANRPPAYFTVLFYGLIIWGIIFMAYYLLSGWSSEGEFAEKMEAHQQLLSSRKTPPPAPTPAAAARPTPPDVQELYAENCAMCHGEAGKGGIGADLTASAYRYGHAPEAVRASIGGGRPGGMPAFGNRFTADELDALTDFVLSLK